MVQLGLPLYGDQRQGDVEAYLHRAGRCGRFGTRGLNISMVLAGLEAQQLDVVHDKLEILHGQNAVPHLHSDASVAELGNLYRDMNLVT